MRKNQIKKLNLSLVFSIVFIILVLGVAYSIYTERYVGGNNYIMLADLYAIGYGDDSFVVEGMVPESSTDALNAAFHPYSDRVIHGETYRLRDNEYAMVLEAKNDRPYDIKFTFRIVNGPTFEDKTRIPYTKVHFMLNVIDLVSGNNLMSYASSGIVSTNDDALSYEYSYDTFVIRGGGVISKYLIKVVPYIDVNSLNVSDSSDYADYSIEEFKNCYTSFSLEIEESSSSSSNIPAPANMNNMGLYKMTGKSSITNISFEHVDENELVTSITSLTRYGYDDEIDLTDMDNSYIDLTYDRSYALTGDYSNSSNCTLLNRSFCANKGTYGDSLFRLSKMVNEIGLYLNRDEIDELVDNGILEKKNQGSKSFVFGFVDDGTLTIKYSGDKIYLPSDCQYFFADFSNLALLDFTNVDFSNCKSLAYMFKNDTVLNNVDFRRAIKKTWTSTRGMFYNCTSLVNYSFSYNATSLNVSTTDYTFLSEYSANVYDSAYMFYNCTSLTTDPNNHLLFIDNFFFKGSNILDAKRMFEGCTSLDILCFYQSSGGFFYNFSKILDGSYMFKDCTGLVSALDRDLYSSYYLVINGGVNYEGVFYNCTSLTKLPLAIYCNSINATNMNGISILKSASLSKMFFNCSSATSVGFFLSNSLSCVSDISYMFANCTSLTSFDVSSSTLFDNLKDINHCFYNCSSITKIVLSKFGTKLLTNAESLFEGCSSITMVNTSSSDGVYDLKFENVFNVKNMFKDCSELQSFILRNGYIDVSPNDFNALFVNCMQLNSITFDNCEFGKHFGNGIDSYGNSMFTTSNFSLSSELQLKVMDCDMTCMTDIKSFFNNDILYSLYIENTKFDKDVSMVGMFMDNTRLRILSFDPVLMNGNIVYNQGVNLENFCKGCTNLLGFRLGYSSSSNSNHLKVSNFNYALRTCGELMHVILDDVNLMNAELVQVFYNDSHLLDIRVTNDYKTANNNQYWNDIGLVYSNAFYGCINLPGYDSSHISSVYGKLTDDGGYFESGSALF